MKTILIATDFSANARHAAEYGYKLAKQIKGNVIIYNTFMIPAEVTQADIVVWPEYEYETLLQDSSDELKALKEHLTANDDLAGINPPVTCTNEMGPLHQIINDALIKNEADLLIIGTHSRSGLNGLILGNHCRMLIDTSVKPTLLVPPGAPMLPIKKIAFASDFRNIQDDLASIYKLIGLAKSLNAEILLAYVYDEKYHSAKFEKRMDDLLTELSNKADYANIYYRLIKNRTVQDGLIWLCEHGKIDMLAMVHRKYTFFDKVLKGSHTQKMAKNISIPLLVFPGNV